MIVDYSLLLVNRNKTTDTSMDLLFIRHFTFFAVFLSPSLDIFPILRWIGGSDERSANSFVDYSSNHAVHSSFDPSGGRVATP